MVVRLIPPVTLAVPVDRLFPMVYMYLAAPDRIAARLPAEAEVGGPLDLL